MFKKKVPPRQDAGTQLRMPPDYYARLVKGTNLMELNFDFLIQGRLDQGPIEDETGSHKVKAFLNAACVGNLADVRRMLKDHVVRVEDHHLVHLACHYDQPAVLKEIIEAGADVDEEDNAGDTGLIIAARRGHVDQVQMLIRHGAKLDTRSKSGTFALFEAVEGGHLDVVDHLLRAGALASRRETALWRSPLHLAAERGYDDIVETLLRQGADVEARDAEGQLPITLAKMRSTRALMEGFIKQQPSLLGYRQSVKVPSVVEARPVEPARTRRRPTRALQESNSKTALRTRPNSTSGDVVAQQRPARRDSASFSSAQPPRLTSPGALRRSSKGSAGSVTVTDKEPAARRRASASMAAIERAASQASTSHPESAVVSESVCSIVSGDPGVRRRSNSLLPPLAEHEVFRRPHNQTAIGREILSERSESPLSALSSASPVPAGAELKYAMPLRGFGASSPVAGDFVERSLPKDPAVAQMNSSTSHLEEMRQKQPSWEGASLLAHAPPGKAPAPKGRRRSVMGISRQSSLEQE